MVLCNHVFLEITCVFLEIVCGFKSYEHVSDFVPHICICKIHELFSEAA